MKQKSWGIAGYSSARSLIAYMCLVSMLPWSVAHAQDALDGGAASGPPASEPTTTGAAPQEGATDSPYASSTGATQAPPAAYQTTTAPASAGVAPVPVVTAPPPTSSLEMLGAQDPEPVRGRRLFGISGEIGWNSLPGMGPVITYHVIPELALEAAVGLSLVGFKGGVRARWNILRSSWTPTVGFGVMYGAGLGDDENPIETLDGEAGYRVTGSPFVQLVGGVNFVAEGGFMFSALAGYAVLLRENIEMVYGPQSALGTTSPAYGSGPVVSVGFGAAF